MLCEAVFELISGHIDGINTPDEEAALQAHLAVCEDCRNTLRALSEIELDVRSLQTDPPVDLKDNIMEAIRTEAAKQEKKTPEKKPRRWLQALYGVGAVAALLALVLGTGIVKLPGLGSGFAKDAAPAQAAAEAAAPEDSYAAAGEALPEVYNENGADLTQAPEYAEAPAEAVEAYDGFAMEEETKTAYTEAPAAAADAAGSDISNDEETEAYVGAVLATPNEVVEAAETRRKMLSAGISDNDDLDFITELCLGQTKPMLVISGPSDSFLTLLELLAPELGEKLDKKQAEEEEDRLIFETDFDTAAALAEWLELIVPKDAAGEDPSLEELLEYDPENSCLKALTKIPEGDRLLLMREIFTALFGSDNSWSILYPDNTYKPTGEDTAYIVLIPS